MFRLVLLAMAMLTQLVLAPAPAAASPAASPVSRCASQTAGSWNLDGIYGPFTERAVRAFQRAHGLRVDGIAGPRTLKALGWRDADRWLLKCGSRGKIVLHLQLGLARTNYWGASHAQRPKKPEQRAPRSGAASAPKSPPRASPSPQPRPTPKPQPSVSVPTPPPPAPPSPAPSALPSEPSALPSEMPSALPSELPAEELPAGMPELDAATPPPSPAPRGAQPGTRPELAEVSRGLWFNGLAQQAGGQQFAMEQPSWNGQATVWRGAFGLGGEIIGLNPTTAAVPTLRHFQPNSFLWSAALKFRLNEGNQQVSAGYRSFTQSGLGFITAGLSSRSQLGFERLWLDTQGLIGGNTDRGYHYDLHTRLVLDLSPVELAAGYRHMAISRFAPNEPLYMLSGPLLSLSAGF